MGLFGAMTSAVSGLQAQAFAMQNISGNIANSQTIAYKGINTNFEDLVPGVTQASQQVAGGVLASSVATNTSQGAIQSSTSSTAMAINGDGYFVVAQPTSFSGNTPVFSGVEAYTRRGDFQLNSQGYLVNGSGYYLEGMPIDPSTGNPLGTTAAPLQFQNNFLPANPTSAITYGINLPAKPQTGAFDPTVPNSELLKPSDFASDPTTAGTGIVDGADSAKFVNESVDGGSVTVYNANGTPANLQLRWAKIDSVANGGSDKWNLFYETDSTATGTNPAWTNVGTNFAFDATGQLSPSITSVTLTSPTVDGVPLGNITLNSSIGAITQFSSTNGSPTVNNMLQNGYSAGQLQSISVTSTGTISGTFTNGQLVPLAAIPLVHFNSANNLTALDGGGYQATVDSGQALAGASGKIAAQSLEGSNTDIATEFTKLIVTQQAYSANTKVITTANQMSQDLMNILR
jgi:flagellar hook protein FlgE